jgi:monoamine oxidase
LRHLAAGVSLPAWGQVTELARRGTPQDIVVLGAGLAGLCCAWELLRQAHKVTVLEAQTRPGGRVRTLREGFAPGLYAEAGPDTIPARHDITIFYAKKFGLELLPAGVQGKRSLYHVKGRRVMPGDKAVWPYELTAEERILGMAGLSRKYVTAASDEIVAAGFDKDPVQALSRFDLMMPGEWLRGAGASAAATELLTLGFGTEFGSAASFLLHGLSFRGGGGGFRIAGGNDGLPNAFAKEIPVRYGSAVESVTQDERGVSVVVQRRGSMETLHADRVVCTLPCPVVGPILNRARVSEAKQKAIHEQFYSQTTKVFLQTSERFWLKQGLSGSATTDLPIERLMADPGTVENGRGALVAYPIGDFGDSLGNLTPDERQNAALAQARTIFPELEKTYEGGTSWSWGEEPWQKGAFALHKPGQIGFIDVLAKAEGRLHFAGEHTSRWTGWMQGALDSARRVVEEINDRAKTA